MNYEDSIKKLELLQAVACELDAEMDSIAPRQIADYISVFLQLIKCNNMEIIDSLREQSNPFSMVMKNYFKVHQPNQESHSFDIFLNLTIEREKTKTEFKRLFPDIKEKNINDWLDDIQGLLLDMAADKRIIEEEFTEYVSSFQFVLNHYGKEYAKKILLDGFLFPHEIKAAAVYLSKGGSLTNINAMHVLGYLDEGANFKNLTDNERKEIEDETQNNFSHLLDDKYEKLKVVCDTLMLPEKMQYYTAAYTLLKNQVSQHDSYFYFLLYIDYPVQEVAYILEKNNSLELTDYVKEDLTKRSQQWESTTYSGQSM